jgi:magnesium chelatase family protein
MGRRPGLSSFVVRAGKRMLARIQSAAIQGIDAVPVSVEVDVHGGLPALSMVGLPDAAVRESRDRVRAAIQNSSFTFPPRRITVNLAPAHLRKQGTALDLPVAIGILVATGTLPADCAAGLMMAGELSLDGGLRPVRGALSLALAARDQGCRGILLPEGVAGEASAVDGIEVYAMGDLLRVASFLRGESRIEPVRPVPFSPEADGGSPFEDLSDVRGQAAARRALEVSAAGGHNLILVGPPGAGKTMLARRLPGILPSLGRDEAVEATRIHGAAGLRMDGGLMTRRPFRAPHHSISAPGLIGGGWAPRPGEVTLAHLGVLFLDELPEFRPGILEALRQPMEEGRVIISRVAQSIMFPARFILVAAMNPCPCGNLGNPGRDCACTPIAVRNYRGRISGPLLDRFDIHLEVPRVGAEELGSGDGAESSAAVRARVLDARAVQATRQAGAAASNAEMTPAQIREHCALDAAGRRLLHGAVDRLGLSARAHHRILKVARTLADLEGEPRITSRHLAEAIQYRVLDRSGV